MNKINLSVYTTALITSVLLSACGSSSDDNSPATTGNPISDNNITQAIDKSSIVSVSFEEVPMLTNSDSASYIESLKIGSESKSITYSPLMSTGHSDNGEIFGAVKDANGELITFSDGSPYICNGTNDGVGSGLDFTSIIHKDEKIYMVSQFECSIGAMYMAELEQDESGVLTPKENTLEYIDQKSEFGGWTHCAGMTTPWQSHLGSEEYESNAKSIENGSADSYYSELKHYWGNQYDTITPYYYGWTTEVQINSSKAEYTKHYSMGRFSHELAYIMPDKKTAYMSDDGTNVGFYMFMADSEEDLTAGTLYAAKFNQKESNRGGSFDLEWISLGHASDTQIRAMVESKPKFSDIFEIADPLCAQQCPTGFTSINTTAGHECLKVKSGQELMASRLETRRYAAMLGATTEIRKEEGITYDPVHNRLYVAISEISKGMEESESYDKGGNNHIALPNNICGAVYALDLSRDNTIGSSYTAENFYAIAFGEPKDYAGTEYEGNRCDINNIANPDNVTYIPNSDVLLISEDTSHHKNNMVWALNVTSGDLKRIVNTPAGAEASGIFWYQNINDYSYLSLVTQHPSVAKESSVGLFSIKEALTPNVVLAENQTACEASGKTWNADLEQCFITLAKPDYTQAAVNDVMIKKSSCYTSGEGVVFGSDFECGLTQPWKIHSNSSDLDWDVVNYGSYFMKITGYQADGPSDDWMISPKFSLVGDEVLSFDYALNYSPSICKVMVSTDYDGASDPANATWTTLAEYTESLGNWDFIASDEFNLSAYAGKDAYIAFHHTNAVTGKSGTWEIDNVVVSGSGSVTVPFQGDFTLSKTALLTTEYLEMKSSVSGGENPYSFSWDLGNGETKTDEKFCYRYEAAGDYNITLSVTDKNGLQTTTTPKQVSVNTPLDESVPTKASDIRVASFNAYLNRASEGQLHSDLLSGEDEQIKNVAHIVQLVKPDVLLINEFDYNSTENVDLLLEKYFKVAQGEEAAIDYPYYYVAPVNTGVQSGLDYNKDGKMDGNDAFGFGDFAGQYGMVIFSKYPIETANIRTFQKFLWKDMPDFYEPQKDGSPYYSTEVMNQYRLSSKSHWDIPVTVNGKTFHVLASHPTPPVFDDGDKDKDSTLIDWNGLRNHDEIRLWADYVKGESYIYDDTSVNGGLNADTRFVIMGDQNADPDEGDSYKNAIMQLLDNTLINSTVTPTSLGATSEGANAREDDDTAGWSMRADYVLPSTYGFEVDNCGVFWPQLSDVKHFLVEQSNGGENSSDHRLVWCDLNVTDANSSQVSGTESNNTFSIDFESNSFGNWSIVNYASDDYNWEVVNYGSYMAKMTAYKDAANTADDWLISPATIFEAGQLLDFDHVLNYDGSVCKVLISTDYDGQGNPVSATWTTLATYTDSMGNWDLRAADTINLSGYAGMNGYIAFQYTNTVAGTAGTWEIDNIALSK
ncbi:MAG: choice-of-anchor J domain-containing protein [Campylobacterota bacterium]|nr:choice-of-anchor J domain-containing protein [Campylobacterota bacterium]